MCIYLFTLEIKLVCTLNPTYKYSSGRRYSIRRSISCSWAFPNLAICDSIPSTGRTCYTCPATKVIRYIKLKFFLKGSLDSIPSPSFSVKIQIMSGEVSLRCKGKTLLGLVNKLLKTTSLLTLPSNVLPYYT